MPSTTLVSFVHGVRAIGDRTDDTGTAVTDYTAREDAFPHETLEEGIITPAAGFEVTHDTGMTVNVGSGTSYADVAHVVSTEEQQTPYLVRLEETQASITLDASDADDRIDEIYLIVEDDTWDGSGRRLPRLAYRKGDASTSPTAPGPDAGWHAWLLLAEIFVGAGVSSISDSNITDKRIDSAILARLFEESHRSLSTREATETTSTSSSASSTLQNTSVLVNYTPKKAGVTVYVTMQIEAEVVAESTEFAPNGRFGEYAIQEETNGTQIVIRRAGRELVSGSDEAATSYVTVTLFGWITVSNTDQLSFRLQHRTPGNSEVTTRLRSPQHTVIEEFA